MIWSYFKYIFSTLDNAYDPDVSAKQFWIDKTAIRGHDCLTFMDNGAGMDYDKMHKMLRWVRTQTKMLTSTHLGFMILTVSLNKSF